jgi:hypothetical protein
MVYSLESHSVRPNNCDKPLSPKLHRSHLDITVKTLTRRAVSNRSRVAFDASNKAPQSSTQPQAEALDGRKPCHTQDSLKLCSFQT